MTTDLKIEDAQVEDAETLDNIQKACWLEIYPNETYGITRRDILAGNWNSKERLAEKKKEISEMNLGNIHIWVAKDESDEVVGFCTASRLATHGYIERMYILPEFHGRGLGKRLIQKSFNWLDPNLEIRLEVVSYNSYAIGFYKKMGFEECGKVPPGYEGNKLQSGKEIPRIKMVKMAK